MKRFIATLATVLLSGMAAFAQVPGPQIPLTGSIGVPGSSAVLGYFPVSFTSDANHTLTPTEWANHVLLVTSTVSLTATRNLIAPNNFGQDMIVQNKTTGGQSIQVISSSGTGVTIPNGQSAEVFFDGTNYAANSSGAGISGSGTTGTVPIWAGSTALGNSPIDLGVTLANNLTIQPPNNNSIQVLSSGTGTTSITAGSGVDINASTGNVRLESVASGGTVQVVTDGNAQNMSFPSPGFTGTVGVLEGSTTATHCINVASDGVGLQDTGAPCGTVTTSIRPFDTCIANGDSTTFGTDAVSRYASMPSVVSTHINVGCLNMGHPGITSNGEDSLLLAQTPLTTAKGLNIYQIGTNNVTSNGADTNQLANFRLNILSQYALLALPSHVDASSFTYSGSWTTGSYTTSRKSTTSGSTATFSVTGSIILLSTVMQPTFTNGGSATLTCDGTPTGVTLQFAGAGSENITVGVQTGLNIVTGLTNTTHSCVVAVTSSSPGIVDLVWEAGLSGSPQTTYAYLIAPSLYDRSAVDANTPNYQAAESSVVTQLNGYGLVNIKYVSESGVLTSAINYNDNLHPSEYGYYLGAQPIISQIDALGLITPTLPNQAYYGATLTNNAILGSGQNLFFGYNSGSALTTGDFDFAGGYNAANAITTGSNDVLLGWGAGGAATTITGTVGVGASVLNALTTGNDNTCMGFQAGKSITTGSNNTCVGLAALNSLTTGSQDIAIGYGANDWLTTGTNNIGIGQSAGSSLGNVNNEFTVGTDSILIGSSTGQSVPSATVINAAIAIGKNALFGGSGAVEMGTGTCATANTFCFQGFQFLTSAGVGTFATGSTVNASPICTTANGACPVTSPLSGMTASQVPIAATATTVTSSKAIAGSGAGLTSGPTTATAADVPVFTSTTGGLVDSGILLSSLCQTSGTNCPALYNLGGTLSNSNVTVEPGAGTGASASIQGLDGSHLLTITTGTAPSNLSYAIVNFTASRGHITYCVASPTNQPTALLVGTSSIYFSSTSAFDYAVNIAGVPLAASTLYQWDVSCP